MKQESDIILQVYAAKTDNEAADRLIDKYLPFIKAETAKFTGVIPVEGRDDMLSIAMFAFHQAVRLYEKNKGAFLSYAAKAIRNRLIDNSRKEQRHKGTVSLEEPVGGEDGITLLEKLDSGHDEINMRTQRVAAREEIIKFSNELSKYGLSLTDIADNCPKQERTLVACHKVLAYAKAHPELLNVLTEKKRLPMSQLASGSGVHFKTLERHRSYLVAILLAYTNGFEIIRGHLRQLPIEGRGHKQ
ncbi:MAG: RNA polymerase subunit sigma [Christensenellaceae bacterium]|nr:RNA polymerase subunit sigma [Christensenellaceae bacterium]